MSESGFVCTPAETRSFQHELLFFLLKAAIFVLFIAGMFLFVFGLFRCSDSRMHPACKDGDLVFYYRLQQEYRPRDVVVLEKDGELQIQRIVAMGGDVVDLTEAGLQINGYLQQEPDISTETLPYTEGISFPVTVPPGEFFVLGDNRPQSKDSRSYGTVSAEEIKGLVITLLRRRGF